MVLLQSQQYAKHTVSQHQSSCQLGCQNPALILIDLISYIAQSISYRVDLNARENFIDLAERKESVLRLARLISYQPKRNEILLDHKSTDKHSQ